jgi:hypothetical protein
MHFESVISGIVVVNMPNELIPIWVATLVIFTTMARGKGERRKTRIRGGRSSVNARGLIFDIDDLECNVCEIYILHGVEVAPLLRHLSSMLAAHWPYLDTRGERETKRMPFILSSA